MRGYRRGGRLCAVTCGAAPLALAAALLCHPGKVHAFAWMIRHEYTGCAVCHADPSGSGLLTEYGRAQAQLLIETRYSHGKVEEAGPTSHFAFGALDRVFTLPSWLLLGGSYRGAELIVQANGGPKNVSYIQMEADLYAQVTVGHFRANGSIGYVPQGARAAAITNTENDNIVSREHWVGWDFGSRSFLLRAGRMNLPFGLRNVEHTTWIRNETRTDINSQQQHGVALAYSGERLRAELMGILGNFQTHPGQYRELGYSGYAELAIATRAAVGLSSLITHARKDVILDPLDNLRQAHGVFARYSPWSPLVLLAEADLLVQSPSDGSSSVGYVGFLQLDFQIIQGLHLMPMFELRDTGRTPQGIALGGWLTADWFFAPHSELRFDFFNRRLPGNGTLQHSLGGLIMLHIFL